MVCNGFQLQLHLFPVCSCECAMNPKDNWSLCVNIVIYVFMSLHMRDCTLIHLLTVGMGTEVNPSTAVRLSSLAFVHPHGKKTPRTLRYMQLFTSFTSYYSPPSSLSSGLSSGGKTNPCNLNHSLKSFHL